MKFSLGGRNNKQHADKKPGACLNRVFKGGLAFIRARIGDFFSRIDVKPLIIYSALIAWAGFGALFFIFSDGGEDSYSLQSARDLQEITQIEVSPAVLSPVSQDEFEELLAQNTIGYIKIGNTAIDCPVVQGRNHVNSSENGYDGRSVQTGAVFMDYDCNIQDIGQCGNMVVYGYTDSGAFQELLKYKEKRFFDDNSIIEFNTLNCDHKWEIFSVYNAEDSSAYSKTKFISRKSFSGFVQECKSKSIYQNDVNPEEDDTILTLAACGGKSPEENFIVQARLLRPEQLPS